MLWCSPEWGRLSLSETVLSSWAMTGWTHQLGSWWYQFLITSERRLPQRQAVTFDFWLLTMPHELWMFVIDHKFVCVVLCLYLMLGALGLQGLPCGSHVIDKSAGWYCRPCQWKLFPWQQQPSIACNWRIDHLPSLQQLWYLKFLVGPRLHA